MEKQRGNTILIVIFSVLLAAMAGVSVFFWRENSAKSSDIKDLKDRMENLRNRIDEEASSDVVDEEVEPEACDLGLPVVVYVPGGLFDSEEKNEIRSKLVDPYFDYRNEDTLEFVTMKVEKFSELPSHGYQYEVEVISIDGVYEGFLYGQDDPLEWWIPECLGGCTFSEEFESKYPEIIELAT